jgi:hypothetical protein
MTNDISLVFSLFLVAFLGIGVPQPISMPPLPEEAIMAHAAPRDAIAWFSWSGTAPITANPTNRAERLAAEPEVQNLFASLQRAIGAGPRQQIMSLVLTMLRHPGMAFVEDWHSRDSSKISAGLLLKLDQDIGRGKAALDVWKLALATQPETLAADDLDVGDIRFRALPMPAGAPFVGWAEHDGWLAIACGTSAAEQLGSGLAGGSLGLMQNPEFVALRTATNVERPATRAFLDSSRLLPLILADGGYPALDAAQLLGIDQAESAMSTSGLEGNGACYRVRIVTPTDRGLLGALAKEPIRQDELLQIPADADLALALRIDPEHAREQLAGGIEEANRIFKRRMNIDLQSVLLDALRGDVTAWSAPSQGSLLGTALTVSASLREGHEVRQGMESFRDAIYSLNDANKANREGSLGRNKTYLVEEQTPQGAFWWSDIMDDDLFVAPAWAATEEHLVFALSPQAMRDSLRRDVERNPDRSIVRVPAVNRRGSASLMLHVDLRSALDRAWPWMVMGLRSLSAQWQYSDGFRLDISALPSPSSVLPHLGHELLLVTTDDNGLSITRTGSMPCLDPGFALLSAGLVGGAIESMMGNL